MVFRDEEGFKLAPYKVRYTQDGEAQTNYTDEVRVWEAYQELGHISDLVIEDAIYSPEQLARLEKVKGYPESEHLFIEAYVLEGELNESSQLAKDLQIKSLEAENVALKDSLLENMSATAFLFEELLQLQAKGEV